MAREFVSERIEPAPGVAGGAATAPGEPIFPVRFQWRGKEYALAEIVRKWKETGPDKGGGAERYLRKHWFEIRTHDGLVMTIYFERQARSQRQATKRWWLYTVLRDEER